MTKPTTHIWEVLAWDWNMHERVYNASSHWCPFSQALIAAPKLTAFDSLSEPSTMRNTIYFIQLDSAVLTGRMQDQCVFPKGRLFTGTDCSSKGDNVLEGSTYAAKTDSTPHCFAIWKRKIENLLIFCGDKKSMSTVTFLPSNCTPAVGRRSS